MSPSSKRTGRFLTGVGAGRRGERGTRSSAYLVAILIDRDGPALRALTLIPYAHHLLDRKRTLDAEYVTHSLYDARLIRAHGKVIKNDLEEVARGWWMEGFDLWEEV